MNFKSNIYRRVVKISGIGSVMGLIALLFDWYIFDCSGKYCDNDLPLSLDYFDMFDLSKLNWAGNQLPLILSVVCFSVALLLVIYAIASTKIYKRILLYASIVSVLALLAHIGYLEVESYNYSSIDDRGYVLPHIGWVLAFIGSVLIIIGATMHEREQENKDRFGNKKSVTYPPNTPEFYDDRGITCGKEKLFSMAITNFSKAIDLDSHYAVAYFNRAQAYEQQGSIREAISDYEVFITLSSNADQIKEAQASIESLSAI